MTVRAPLDWAIARGPRFRFEGRVLVRGPDRIVLGGSAQGAIPIRVDLQEGEGQGGRRCSATVIRGMATVDGLYLELRPEPTAGAADPALWTGRAVAGRMREALKDPSQLRPSDRDLLRDLLEFMEAVDP